MIDNFKVIDKFLQFEEGTFYKFELLVRNTDGENILFPERCSNTNRNILIKSWYVDTKEYYEKIKHEMITLSNLTGARLYVTLDRKDNVKLVQNLLHSYTDSLVAICNGQKPSIKSISKTFASETSKVENSSKSTKTIMFDVDTKDGQIKQAVIDYIESKGQKAFILETKKGYHIFCFRKFNHADWLNYISQIYMSHFENINYYTEENVVQEYTNKIQELVSVKENELGLVYHPMKNESKFDINNLKDTYTYLVDYQLYSDGKDAMYKLKEFADFKEAKSFYEECKEDDNVKDVMFSVYENNKFVTYIDRGK